MSRRRYSKYLEPGHALYVNGAMASSEADQKLANAAIATYAETRRNIACYPINTPASISITASAEDEWEHWFELPIRTRVITPGTLKILFYGRTQYDGTGSKRVRIKALYRGAEAVVTGFTTSNSWHSATMTLNADGDGVMYSDETFIHFYTQADDVNTLSVDCTVGYQPEDSSSPASPSTASASVMIGTDDWPDSVLANRKLEDMVTSVRGQRTVKSNVWAHWFRYMEKTGSGYSANADALGRYMFVKRRGVSKIIVNECYYLSSSTAKTKLTIGGTAYSNASAEVTVVANAGIGFNGPIWVGHEFSLSSTDITNEVEIELKVDAANPVHIPGIEVQEVHLSSTAVTHTVPDLDNCDSGDYIHASEHENIYKTMNHLYRRGGMAIALQDWRFTHSTSPTWDALHCTPASADKTDYGSYSSVIARAICFPSTNAKRIRANVGFKTVGTAGYTKAIEMQLATSLTTANYDERGPKNGDPWYTDRQAGNTWGKVGEMDIPASWEETPASAMAAASSGLHAGTCWVFGYTENTSQYIKPEYVAIEEETLTETEFP